MTLWVLKKKPDPPHCYTPPPPYPLRNYLMDAQTPVGVKYVDVVFVVSLWVLSRFLFNVTISADLNYLGVTPRGARGKVRLQSHLH